MKLGRNFLPISIEDMKNQSIDELDFIIVTGDAYVDHPSFGTAIIGRILEYNGYKVGIIPQPNWKDVESFKVLGRPKLGFLVNSGNIDSMVNHYSVSKRKRRDDLYSPGGEPNHRPDRAVIVYCNMIRQAYKDVPIVIGGIEASLRRFAHYDYWDDKIRRSILLDSKADLLIYGMGEKTIVQIADLLKYGMNIKNITDVRGTCYMSKNLPDNAKDYVTTPCFEDIEKSKDTYNESYKIEYYEQDPINGRGIIQQYGDRYLIVNRPQEPLTEEEMDISYNLPYMRTYHPIYEEKGGIPAITEVKFSITSHRGCFGSCAFCALTFHQGRIIQHRSEESIVEEAKLLTTLNDFKGYIHDIGGPTANFRNMACKKQETHGACRNRQCMFPTPCKNLKADHSDYLHILRRVRALPGIKKVFIRSGIRYDYLIHDKNMEFFNDLCKYHISGQLKVAPEHISDKVLLQMGKPSREVYDRFSKKYFEINKKINKKQFLVPYLMSSHPGSDLKAAIELSQYIKQMGHNPEQVQDFYPTPGSLATTIYYTGINPLTGEKVYVPRSPKEKAMQRALLQFEVPENYNLVKDALLKAGREDLIGNGKDCLIPFNAPSKNSSHKKYQGKNNKHSSSKSSSSSNRNLSSQNRNSNSSKHDVRRKSRNN